MAPTGLLSIVQPTLDALGALTQTLSDVQPITFAFIVAVVAVGLIAAMIAAAHLADQPPEGNDSVPRGDEAPLRPTPSGGGAVGLSAAGGHAPSR